MGVERIEVKTGNGRTVSYNTLKYRPALKSWGLLCNIIKPAVQNLLGDIDPELVDGLSKEGLAGLPEEVSMDKIGEILGSIISTMGDDRVLDLVDSLLNEVMYHPESGGKPEEVNVDDFFAGNLGEMVDVVRSAVEENFKSFLEANGIKGLTSLLLKAPTSSK